MYANVIIDISHEKLDRTFQYRIPEQLLPEITVPVIIFSGESKGHHSTMGEYYKSQITTYCEHHVFRKGGHMLFFIEYEEFNEILESFIKRCNDSVTKIS